MVCFTIRVLLHGNATWFDYAQLSTKLAEHNIIDVITSNDGVKYKLPPAEYQCHSGLSATQARDICVAVAKTIGKSHAVLVTKSKERAWVGLAKD